MGRVPSAAPAAARRDDRGYREYLREEQRRRCRRAAGTRRAHGGCGRALRCSSSAMSRIASSSRLDLASQAPCARPMLLLGQAPKPRRRGAPVVRGSTRNAGTRGAAVWARGSSGSRSTAWLPACRACGVWMCATSNVGVWDSALSESFSVYVLRFLSAANRGSPHFTLQSHALVFRLVPHCGQSPLHASVHKAFIGSANW